MSAGPDEVAELRAAVEQLATRVARLEQQIAQPATSADTHLPSRRFGVTAINRIGSITLAIGIIFFFKYAVDENLIGAAAGVALGVLFGIVLIVAGDWLQKRQQRVFAQGIAGCGLAALYISFYASFGFYKLVTETAGFIGLVLVCGVAVALSIRFASAAIAALAFIGALLTPMLLHSKSSEAWLEFAYLLIVNATAIAIGMRQRWPVLAAISGGMTLIAGWFLFEPSHSLWFAISALCIALGYMGAGAAAAAMNIIRNTCYVIGHIGLVVAGMRFLSLAVDRKGAIQQLDSVLIACYGIALIAYGISRASRVVTRLGLVFVGTVVAKLYVWDIWSLERVYRISAFLVLGVLLLAASWVYSRAEKA
jgi:uncharacterized membrane protein